MLDKGWISLSDYSNKYRVSMSTLRRRIRSNEIEHQFDQGKYWLRDTPVLKHTRFRPKVNEPKPQEEMETISDDVQHHDESHTLLASANKLLKEIKGAYVQIMKEKEEQLLQLRKEVADLKTLVKILESENQKLRGYQSGDRQPEA